MTSFSKSLSLVLITFGAAAATACSAGAPNDSAASDTSDLSGSQKGLTCKGGLFDNHPHTSTTRLKNGTVVPVPFWACGMNATLVFGLVDYAPIAALAKGTGYTPYATTYNGVKKAIARIFLDRINGSDSGPYNEIAFSYEATLGDEIDLPWVNAYSAAVPAFSPGDVTVFSGLYLDHKAPIAYGREVLGLNKHAAFMPFSYENDKKNQLEYAQYFAIGDDTDVLFGDLAVNDNPSVMTDFANGIAAAIGIPVSALPAPGLETPMSLATIDAEDPAQMKQIAASVLWSSPSHEPIVNAWDNKKNSLYLNPKNQLAAPYASFTPMVLFHDANTSITLFVSGTSPIAQ